MEWSIFKKTLITDTIETTKKIKTHLHSFVFAADEAFFDKFL